MSGVRAFARIGLGLVAGAVLQIGPVAARAQVVPPPASDVPVPPAPETDPVVQPPDTIPRDTIKPPVGRAPLVRAVALAPQYVWEGDEILASGAYTLADLLHTVPELTVFRTGWILSPQFAALAGDFGRVRLFLDGIELDAIDPREFGSHDLGRIPLWTLARVAVERTGAEVRVHARTWTVERTTPFTRTDVYTGNEDTNIYRGYYGKRFDNGGVFQAGAEHGSTDNVRFGGGGDAVSFISRAGVGRALWSVDGLIQSNRRHRRTQTGVEVPPLPAYEATHVVAYLRAAAGHQDGGPWLELLASTQRVSEGSPRIEMAAPGIPADTVDTTAVRNQYVLRGGYRFGPLALTLADRLRRYDDRSENAVSARAELNTTWLAATGYVERGGEANVADALVRLQPVRFFGILLSGASREFLRRPQPFTSTALRLEAGLNLGGIWLYGGTLSLSGRSPFPVSPFDVSRAPAPAPGPAPDTGFLAPADRATAVLGGVRGIGWRGFGANTYVLRWNESEPGEHRLYVPQHEARTELNFQTQWLSRFPRGEFGFRIAVADEFRSGVEFVTGRAGASHVLWGLIEVRIQRATLTFQTRNPLGRQYFLVPGFEMPRSVSTYGVRWSFWG